MKCKRLLLMLLLALIAPWAAMAQETLTVYDQNTTTNEYVPIYGLYCDEGVKCEFVIPADQLEDMANGTISAMKFYLASVGYSSISPNFTIFVKEVDFTTMTAYTGTSGATTVFNNTISFTTGTSNVEVDIPFSEDYTYGGGNLLIGVYQNGTSGYSSLSWTGVSQNYNSAWRGYGSSSGSAQTFLPKTTFTYTPGEAACCPKPKNLTCTATTGTPATATFTWTNGDEETQWQLEYGTASDFTGALTVNINQSDLVNGAYTLTGLTAEQTYYARIKAYCASCTPNYSEPSNTCEFKPTAVQNLTVNDGTTTNGYVPIYGYYVDGSIVSQFIMPAEGLAAMQWGTISKLTFYASTASAGWANAQFEVYMTEVDYTTFSSTTLVDWTTMDKVMNAAHLEISGNQMVVTLDAPYQYMGGNLLIGVKQTTSGTWGSCYWYGVAASGASLGGNNSGSQQNFLPKTTFEFTPGEEPDCYMPTGLAVNYTGGTEATISWTSEATAWNIDVNGTVTAINENPYTLTGLELATNYEVKVQADCGDSQSDWTNAVSFTTDLCIPENQCQISYVLGSTDSYYSGWSYGASISVVDTETNTTIATLNTEGSGTVSVCDGRDIQFVWNSASYYNSYCTYTVSDVNGEVIFSGSGALSTPVNYTVNCTITNCKKPTNVAASQVGPRSAVLSWTENGEATAWVVAYKEATATDFTEVNASTNPFTLEGLTPETAYTVKVKPECDVEKWSDETGFTTTVVCPAPTAFAASNITAHTATLSWTGTSESYEVKYRTAAYMNGIEEGFGTSLLPTGWTRYTGLVDNVMAGTATLESATSGWSFDTNNGVFDNHARTNIYGASWNKWLVTPSIEVSGHLSFDLALTAYGGTLAAPQTTGTDDRFIVLVSTDEKATWTILREWNNSGSMYVYNDITCSATGENVTIDLSSYMGQTVYIAFYGESTASNADNNLHIDNVTCGTPVPAGAWQDAVVEGTTANLSGLLAETKYEATVQGDCGTDGTSAVVSTTFTTDIACPAPTALSYANVKSTSVDLSWTNGGAENWVVAFKKASDENFTEKNLTTTDVTIEGSTVKYTLTGLAEETAYTVKVRDNCEPTYTGDGQSEWTSTVSFTTMAACSIENVAVSDITHYTANVSWDGESASDFTVKYRTAAGNDGSMLNEDFSSLTSGIPADWDNSEGTTTSDSYKWTYYNNGHDAAPCLRFNSYSNSYNNTNFLKTPAMNFPAGKTAQLVFWWKNPTGGDFSVYISTDGGTTKTPLKEGLTGQTSWKEETINLTGYEGVSNVTIHFKGTSNYGNGDAYIYLDEVVIGVPLDPGTEQTVSATDSPANLANLEAGTKYEVKVVPNCDESLASEWQSFTTVSADEKWFVTGGNWGTDSNWEPEGVPTISQNVTLLANATIESTCVAEAKSINGTGTGTNAKTLTIKDGGKLKHLNSNVRATVEKEIRPYSTNYDEESYNNGDYYLIANPLTSTVTPDAENNHLLSGNYDLYNWSYNPNDGLEWRNYEASNFSLSSGAYGYLYANETGVTLTYTGTINAYTSSKSRYCSIASNPDSYDFPGWYLLGNPYLYDAYLATAGTNGNALPYIKMNDAGNGFENVAAGTPIEPMEGFFYQQATTSGNVYVVTSAPTVQSNAMLNMNLRRNNKQLDNAILVFGGDQKLGKMTFRANSSKIFMPVEGKDYAITSVEGQVGEVPVSFKAENNGTYSLSFTSEEVSFSYLHLIDNMTGADVDLLANPTYSFDARTTDYESRFRLVFATGSSVDGDSFGFINGMGNLTIFGIEGEATLQVIDVTGRMLSSETFSGSYEKRLNVAPGVYMLRLINGNDVKVQKMVVR